MKKYMLVCASVFIYPGVFGQNTTNLAGPSTYTKCTSFYITKPLRDMPVMKPKAITKIREARDSMERARAAVQRAKFIPGPFVQDPVMQTSFGTRNKPNGDDRVMGDVPLTNFDGQVEVWGAPPDPDGAVGPNDFVQAINSSYQVYDKSGHSLAGPVDLMTLFPGSEDDGDPIVMYDKFADRWFISEFQVPNSPPYELLVAISKTNDPTGAYYVYTFNVGSNFPDYPKYSIWADGYYCTAQFNVQQIIVLQRNRMLAGSPSAGMITASLTSSPPFGGNNSLQSAPKTLDCDGPLPPHGTPNYLTFFENTNSGGAEDAIFFEKLTTDTTLQTITVTMSDTLPTQPFNAYFTGGSLHDISQPGNSNSLDALDGTFNYRVPYMRFTGYNSVVLCNTVNTGGLVAGIRWYELRQNTTTLKWSIYQQGTYAPADQCSRWNGSICMDDNGNISLAYSSCNDTNKYPSIQYTGRLAGDPLGQMTFWEQTAMVGSSSCSYNDVGGRWGDYSQTTLDPSDGITFWHTNEYGATGGNQNSRIFSFQLIGPSGIASVVADPINFTAYQSGSMLNIKASGLPSNDQVNVDLFDINGKQISSSLSIAASNSIQAEVNVSGLAKGIYLLRIGNVNYQRVKKVLISE